MVGTVVVAGTSSGVGKTSIAVGLMTALRDKGLVVQAFKVGPDFVDPQHHELATGRPSINLDGWMLSREQVVQSFHRHTADADIAVVEGVMGLFDGRDGSSDQGSTAQVAKWLGAPVVMVLDCSAIARSAAAQVKGYMEFDTGLRLGALIFNKVSGEAHTKWMAEAISSAGLGLEVLGGMPKDETVALKQRYLGVHREGLGEEGLPHALISTLSALCKQHIDLDALVKLAGSAEVLPLPPPSATEVPPSAGAGALAGAVRVAVARDAAFCCYYQENLFLLEEAGAELVYFSPLKETLPPGVSGVYLGGGDSLERHAVDLAENRSMRAALRAFAAAGGVVYAECGGLLYLSRSVQPQDEAAVPMVGIFPFKTVMGQPTKAYCEVEASEDCPLFLSGARAKGHVQHHWAILEEHVVGGVSQSSWCGCGKEEGRCYRTGYVARPLIPGEPEIPEGFCCRNVLASFVQLHFGSCPQFAASLVERCRGVDVAALDSAVAEAVAAVNSSAFSEGLGSRGSPSQLLSRGLSPGMLPVRSSPNLSGERCAHGRAHSMDACATLASQHVMFPEDTATSFYGHDPPRSLGSHGRAATSLDFTQHGMLTQRHSMHLPGVGRLSPATTLAKVLSSGSLSNLSAMHQGSADPNALHAVDPPGTASPPSSDSPSSTSPSELCETLRANTSSGSVAGAPASTAALVAGAGLEHYSGGLLGGAAAHRDSREDLFSNAHHYHHGGAYCGMPTGPLTHSHSWSSMPLGYASQPLAAASRRSSSGGGASGGLSGSPPPHHPLAHAAQQQLQRHSPLGGSWAQHAQQQQHLPGRQRAASMGSRAHSIGSLDYAHAAVTAAAAAPSHFSHHFANGVGAPPPHQLQLQLATGLPLGTSTPPASLAASPWHSMAPHPPSDKIVSLSAGAAEMLWALGLGSRVVGVPEGCDYPPEALLRAKALRRVAQGAGGVSSSALAGAGAGGVAEAGGSARGLSTRSNSSDSLSAAPAASDHHSSSQLQAQQEEAAAPAWMVDEEVLARERPGLIVYEEEEQALVNTQPGAAPRGELRWLGGGEAAGAAAAAVQPPSAPYVWPGSSFGTPEREARGGGGWATPPGPAGAGGVGSSSGRPPVGRVGQAVLDALVAVGLQQSCRVVCIRRRSLSEVLDSMLAVGEAAGVGDEAVRVVDRLRARLRRAAGQAAVAAQLGRRPRVLLLQSVIPILTVGCWASDTVVLAGGMNAEEQAGDPPKLLTWEQVQAFAPEVLIVASLHPSAAVAAGPGSAATAHQHFGSSGAGGSGSGCRALYDLSELAARPGWWLLPAVKEGRVFVADLALLCRPGPRLVDGVEALARMIHEDDVSLPCPDKAVLKLSLRPGQRCRHRVLPQYFMPFV